MKIDRNKRRDRRVMSALRRAGWRVFVAWECQTRNPSRLAERLAAFTAAKRR